MTLKPRGRRRLLGTLCWQGGETLEGRALAPGWEARRRLGKAGQYNVAARGERPHMSKAAEGERAEDQAMTIGFTHGEVPWGLPKGSLVAPRAKT